MSDKEKVEGVRAMKSLCKILTTKEVSVLITEHDTANQVVEFKKEELKLAEKRREDLAKKLIGLPGYESALRDAFVMLETRGPCYAIGTLPISE